MLKKSCLSLALVLISLSSMAGLPDQDSQVRQLRDQFAYGHSLQVQNLSAAWKCKHYNAFQNDNWIETFVTMDFYRLGSYAYNSGNFVVKYLKNTSQGLIGKVSIPEYRGAELFSVLRETLDGKNLIGEVSVEPKTLRILGDYYRHGQAFSGPISLVDSTKTVFYYTYCKRLD